MGGLREEVGNLRGEVRTTAAETRRHFDVTAEALRHEIQTVAEGVLGNSAAIAELRVDVRRDLDQHFDVVDRAFAEVRRDITELRSSR
ncbi:MAG: hypothetical protein HY616_07465 [Candidatus Rokubacteria bacterium]|nr:hypothetical protein [Candidatus Rokubacteria bacterium]